MMEWFLAYTKPKHEDSVEYRLKGAGFEVLNPKLRERKLYRRKITDVQSPLFPCYVFIRFDRLNDYHLIKYTRGIKWVLCNENGPASIKNEIIDSIQARLENGSITIKNGFEPGEKVVIKGGPFEGFNAVFEKEMKGSERVSILLKAINVRVVVDSSLLARC